MGMQQLYCTPDQPVEISAHAQELWQATLVVENQATPNHLNQADYDEIGGVVQTMNMLLQLQDRMAAFSVCCLTFKTS